MTRLDDYNDAARTARAMRGHANTANGFDGEGIRNTSIDKYGAKYLDLELGGIETHSGVYGSSSVSACRCRHDNDGFEYVMQALRHQLPVILLIAADLADKVARDMAEVAKDEAERVLEAIK